MCLWRWGGAVLVVKGDSVGKLWCEPQSIADPPSPGFLVRSRARRMVSFSVGGDVDVGAPRVQSIPRW